MKLYLSIVVAGLVAVFVTNMVVDVAGVNTYRHVYELSERQKPGELLVWENLFDQRAWTKAKLERECPDVLVLGSSTVGALDQTMFLGRRFLNGWLTAPTIEDFEALTTVLSHAGCRPATIIVGVDPWLLNAAFKDERWQSLFDDYLVYHEGGVLRAFRLGLTRRWSLFKERLNFTTTRLTLEYLARRLRGERETSAPRLVSVAPETYCTTISSAQYIRSNDGHFTSCPAFVPSREEIDAIARNYVINNGHEIGHWKEVDLARRRRLEAVTSRWRDRGSRVIFLAPPFHPLTYAAMRADQLVASNLDGVDRALAASGFTYVNLRDPEVAGCAGSEFEDSHHAAPSCERKIASQLLLHLP